MSSEHEVTATETVVSTSSSESTGNNNASNAARRVADLVVAGVTALFTFISTIENYGPPRALFLTFAAAASVFFVLSVSERPFWTSLWHSKWLSWCRWLYKRPRHFLGLGFWLTFVPAIGFLIAVWLSGSSLSLFRYNYATLYPTLPIADGDFASDAFYPAAISGNARDQRTRDEVRYDTWIRWMTASVDVAKKDDKGSTLPFSQSRLICVQSVPFDKKYTNASFTVSVNAPLSIKDGIAFLVRDDPDARPLLVRQLPKQWYKPHLRAMSFNVLVNPNTALVELENPNKGERLVLFMRCSAPAGKTFPNKDKLLLNPYLEIDR